MWYIMFWRPEFWSIVKSFYGSSSVFLPSVLLSVRYLWLLFLGKWSVFDPRERAVGQIVQWPIPKTAIALFFCQIQVMFLHCLHFCFVKIQIICKQQSYILFFYFFKDMENFYSTAWKLHSQLIFRETDGRIWGRWEMTTCLCTMWLNIHHV